MSNIFENRWDVSIKDPNGKVIWEIKGKKNILVDSGEKAIVDTFFRNNGSIYLPGSFYVGMYNGSISESTVLATIPNEPAALYGYVRKAIERSTVGWPTIEKHEGDWRITSKQIEVLAFGGNIGPVNGAFLCTSLDDSGTLIGALGFGVEKTVESGSTILLTQKIKLK